MNTNRSQNRALAIVAIVAIVMGLGVGLLWAGVGSTAPSSPSASNQTTTPSNPSASNQTTAQTASASVTPGDDTTIPTVVTSNTGEAAIGGNNNANQPTPTADTSTSPANGSSASASPTPNGNSTTDSANPAPNPSNATTNSGSTATSGATSSTPTSSTARPKRQKTPATPKTAPSGTPAAGNQAANGKGKAKVNAATGNQVAVGGVVDHVDAPNKLVVLDTGFGPLTATLATTATIQRQPVPGDDPSVKTGPISLSDVQVGSYATVLISRDQLPSQGQPKKQNGTPGPTGTPSPSSTPAANDQNSTAAQAKNRETLLKRKFGVGDGFSATVSALRVGPAPASIEQADSNKLLGVHALPASFVALDSDGNIIATITKYGNLRVIVGPGTRFDRLGQPISATDLKPGDSIILYGAPVWVGGSGDMMSGANGQSKNGGNPAALPTVAAGKGTGKGAYANGLPITEHIAELHVVSTNEHLLQGRVTAVDTSANTFQIASTGNETFTVNVAADTKYQSLVAGRSVSSLADLKPGSYVVAYTIGDSDIDPKVYNAKTVDILPAAR